MEQEASVLTIQLFINSIKTRRLYKTHHNIKLEVGVEKRQYVVKYWSIISGTLEEA